MAHPGPQSEGRLNYRMLITEKSSSILLSCVSVQKSCIWNGTSLGVRKLTVSPWFAERNNRNHLETALPVTIKDHQKHLSPAHEHSFIELSGIKM